MQSRQNPTARRELPASGMNRRLIRAPHGKPVVRHSPNLSERWVKTHPDSSYAVDPGHHGRPEYSPFGLPEGSPTSLLAWLLVAVGVLAVTAALWYMTREAGSPWRAAALLTSAVVGCAWILARSAMDIPGFVRRGDPVAVFRSGKMAPFWLLLPATTVTIVAAGRMQSAGAGAVGWSVGLPWLVGVILFMAGHQAAAMNRITPTSQGRPTLHPTAPAPADCILPAATMVTVVAGRSSQNGAIFPDRNTATGSPRRTKPGMSIAERARIHAHPTTADVSKAAARQGDPASLVMYHSAAVTARTPTATSSQASNDVGEPSGNPNGEYSGRP